MMVFNPVYIQKSNDGESQLLGNGFSNQKPTYLFSDIIKVILSKADQAGIPQTEKGTTAAQPGLAEEINPLLISDAEVELYDKLMKLNILGNPTCELENLVSNDPLIMLESIKMFLNGLTNQNETAPTKDKVFEIEPSDLTMVLNIFIGNAVGKNNLSLDESEVSEEMKNLVSEINALLNTMVNKDDQQLVIQQKDFALELKPAKNGKISIKIIEPVKPNPQNKIDLGTNKTEILNANPETEKSFSEIESIARNEALPTLEDENKPVDFQKTEKPVIAVQNESKTQIDNSVITENKTPVKISVNNAENTAVGNLPEKGVLESKGKPTAIKTGSSKKQVTVDSNTVTVSKTEEAKTSKEVKISEETKTPKEVKVNSTVNKNSTAQSTNGVEIVKVEGAVSSKVEQEAKLNSIKNSAEAIKPTVKISTNEPAAASKQIDTKNFFEGKIKVEIISEKKEKTEKSSTAKQVNTVENQQKKSTIQDVKVLAAELPVENVTDGTRKIEIDDTAVKKSDAVQVKNNYVLNSTLADKKPEKVNILENPDELPVEKENAVETPHHKNIRLKEEKINIPKAAVNNENAQAKEALKSSSLSTENQPVVLNVGSTDKKNQNEKTEQEKIDVNKIGSGKEKNPTVVTANKETDQQQNNFEKAFAAINKTENFGKEIKETVKIVDQSRLMNEIENIIKSGERKAVKINLYPEELGSVKVSLEITDKSVAAKINVANDTVRQMILTQAENLKTSLNQSGIQLASLNVSVNNSEEKTAQQGKMKRKESGPDKKLVISDIPNPVKVKNLGYNTYDYIV